MESRNRSGDQPSSLTLPSSKPPPNFSKVLLQTGLATLFVPPVCALFEFKSINIQLYKNPKVQDRTTAPTPRQIIRNLKWAHGITFWKTLGLTNREQLEMTFEHGVLDYMGWSINSTRRIVSGTFASFVAGLGDMAIHPASLYRWLDYINPPAYKALIKLPLGEQFKTIYKTGGTARATKSLFNASSYILFLPLLKDMYQRAGLEENYRNTSAIISASILSATFTTPLDVITAQIQQHTMMQADGRLVAPRMLEQGRNIYQVQGLKAFTRGFSPNLLQTLGAYFTLEGIQYLVNKSDLMPFGRTGRTESISTSKASFFARTKAIVPMTIPTSEVAKAEDDETLQVLNRWGI